MKKDGIAVKSTKHKAAAQIEPPLLYKNDSRECETSTLCANAKPRHGVLMQNATLKLGEIKKSFYTPLLGSETAERE